MGRVLIILVCVIAAVYMANADEAAADATKAAAETAEKAATAATGAADKAGESAKAAASDAKAAATDAKTAATGATTAATGPTTPATEAAKEIPIEGVDTTTASPKKAPEPFAPSISAGEFVDSVNNGVFQTYSTSRKPIFDFLTGLTRIITVPIGAPLAFLGMQDLPKDIVEGGIGAAQGLADAGMSTGYKAGTHISTGLKSTGPILAPINTIHKTISDTIGGASKAIFQPFSSFGTNMFEPLMQFPSFPSTKK